jgi:hypothetical protein
MRFSERIYRILLKAYPKRYLRRYGEPMAQLFSDQLHRANGTGPLLRLWLRTLGDLSRTVPARYFERLLPNRGAFSRYNEAARRSLFFARYEAAYLAHRCITPEDLLLGLLREDRELRGCFNPEALDEIRRAIGVTAGSMQRKVSWDLPLSGTVKQILSLAGVEAERAGTKNIMPRHVAAAILSQGQSLAADLLSQHGINLDRLRIPPE